MKPRTIHPASLLIISILFTIALVYAFIEVPRLLDGLLQEQIGFPQFDHGAGSMNALKTNLFVEGLHLKWIGAGSFVLVLGMIILGYATRRTGWALAGAAWLIIPVFGQFALSMFFLAGLGILRVGWFPLIELGILEFGQVIFIPYWVLKAFFGIFDWNAHYFISFLFMGSGAFLFVWGVTLWFRARLEARKTADSFVYRISRHPQYLGWILWSYGFILFTPSVNQMKKTWSVDSTFPWLLMTMTVIGICLMEEIRMMERTNGEYEEYRSRTPFLFPLPSWIRKPLSWPARKITGGGYPASRRQVVWIVLLYLSLLMLISLIWVDWGSNRPVSRSGTERRDNLEATMSEIRSRYDQRRTLYPLFQELPGFGPEGWDSLSVLAVDTLPLFREYAMQVIGEEQNRDLEKLVIGSLRDEHWRVRSEAILSAGKLGSTLSVDTLLAMLADPRMINTVPHICLALGEIGDERAIPALVTLVEESDNNNQISALNALQKINPTTGLQMAVKELSDSLVEVRRNAVMTCILLGDSTVIEPLRRMESDPDFEVRFYSRQGVKRLKKQYL